MTTEGDNGYVDRPRAGRATVPLPLLALAVTGLAAAGCGSRSSLDGVTYVLPYGVDAGDDGPELDGQDSPADDGTLDQDVDAPVDAPIDAHRDVVVLTNCPDPSSTYIYVVTEQEELFSFYPPTATFMRIGTLACPDAAGGTPYSMAVDRKGTAYVLYDDGELFRVSTRTGRCTATSFASTYTRFGMGFVADPNGTTDTLYITPFGAAVLGTISIPAFNVGVVGPLNLSGAELTGTGDGRLFAFYAPTTNSSAVAQLDPSNAGVIAKTDLTNLPQGNGWAFGFWGGDFYLFTTAGLGVVPSTVTRFRPSDGSQVVVAGLPSTIVGAGVSTCAPQM